MYLLAVNNISRLCKSVVEAWSPNVERCKLNVGIFVSYPPLQRPHSLLGLYAFGSDDVGYFEIQCNILSIAGQQFCGMYQKVHEAYRLDEVARSICSSRAEFEANHPLIIFAGRESPFGLQILVVKLDGWKITVTVLRNGFVFVERVGMSKDGI